MMTNEKKWTLIVLASSLGAMVPAAAQAGTSSSAGLAAIDQYRIKSRAEEIALARSAAPPSIAKDAEILALGERGYETAVKGTNGFVCIVERSWANEFDSAEFWNPKVRAPICFNPPSVRSVLPTYLERTRWILSGVSKDDARDRTKAALAAKKIQAPELGAMCFMMSKDGYLGDDVGGHWHPHLMFFLPPTESGQWGANLPGSPLFAAPSNLPPLTTFMAIVPSWSDGTPAH